jgi:hypothetical protein
MRTRGLHAYVEPFNGHLRKVCHDEHGFPHLPTPAPSTRPRRLSGFGRGCAGADFAQGKARRSAIWSFRWVMPNQRAATDRLLAPGMTVTSDPSGRPVDESARVRLIPTMQAAGAGSFSSA